MPNLTLDPMQARMFLSCVTVGAEGLEPDADARIMEVFRSGVIDGDQITYVIDDGLLDDMKSAFVVGWEGFEPETDTERLQAKAGDEVADLLGVAPKAPAP